MTKKDVRVCEKMSLTLEEASSLTNIGVNKLRQLTDENDCNFVFWNGTKRLIKRKQLEEFIDKAESI